ncbi:Cbb3-type cytochrome oxidase component FixQ [Geoalkalibacter ferrihydriticus]|uniref:Cbb3-type cytochrome oxidase component FixQ n=1 Tax=Geoalkalibacter ferrihydriticus TaxID=392333 RepID=A0A1G9I6V6_9BACT|nr:cbb3-type cytochrome c oxidase subunit 3 [Geoalkalibacter ferrihydriticus]SDL20961.1 Cbb3-type cytochrome oxidase component FixQ [Geoalkalibacter ferrihydriticus]
MGLKEILYLAVTIGMFAVFAAIVRYVYNSKRRRRLEEPKHRMLDED